jgi:hypothetical protein
MPACATKPLAWWCWGGTSAPVRGQKVGGRTESLRSHSGSWAMAILAETEEAARSLKVQLQPIGVEISMI